MPELLLELLSEEIPARMQARAAEDLKRLVCEGLTKAQLSFDRAQAFVTPRRLALVVEDLPDRQPDVREERKGPRVGAPEKAVEGFLRASGLSSIAEAEVRETDKGSFYFAVRQKTGAATADVVSGVLGEVLAGLPWPKSMRWGGGSFRWVRPLHSIIVLFDGAPIPFALPLGEGNSLAARTTTRGHRFLAPGEFAVSSFSDYRDRLRAAKVLLDPVERRALIAERAAALAGAEGLRVREDVALLDEVTGLVEWPVPMLGSIDPRFMDVPPEVLITAMRAHQKYFSLLDADGKLAPRFVLVANTEATDGGAAIVAGNERVLRARLSDAKFFWDEDRKRTLESRVPKLAERVFHAKLGNDLQRTERLAELARELAPSCGADPNFAARAAHLCKADLMSTMVGEFPELQGIMGRYYALHDGEPEVADAIAEHYAPQGPSDRCPTAPVSIAVALADKIDTLIGFFAIHEKPTGSRDPFALRRAALGVIRLVVENNIRVSLRKGLYLAYESYLNATPLERIEKAQTEVKEIYRSDDEDQAVEEFAHMIPSFGLWIPLNYDLLLDKIMTNPRTLLPQVWPDETIESKEMIMLQERIDAYYRIRVSHKPLYRLNFGGESEVRANREYEKARCILHAAAAPVADDLLAFLADRLKVHLREQGVRHDLIAAVFAAGGEEGAEDDIVRLLARVDALRAFLDTDDGANLLVAYRRASNIVRIEENNDNKSYKGEVEEALFAETQEIELHRALSAARAGIERALQGERFGEAMAILSALRAPVDAFFEHVKVNCTDADLRANRLNLLSQIRSALGGVADFSQIEG